MFKRQNKEKIINNILDYMNSIIEQQGCKIKCVYFNFSYGYFNKQNEIIDIGQDWKYFKQKYPKLKDEDIKNALRTCISRNFIDNYFLNREFSYLKLTDIGQGRAISNKLNNKTLLEKILNCIKDGLKNSVKVIITSAITSIITTIATNLVIKYMV